MAMTKAERAEMEKLREELAFRWPTQPDAVRTLRANDDTPEVRGWDFNTHNRTVYEQWSGLVSHGGFYDGRKSGGSQGARALFATKAEAMIALRWALCRDFAAILHIHDQRAEKGE